MVRTDFWAARLTVPRLDRPEVRFGGDLHEGAVDRGFADLVGLAVECERFTEQRTHLVGQRFGDDFPSRPSVVDVDGVTGNSPKVIELVEQQDVGRSAEDQRQDLM